MSGEILMNETRKWIGLLEMSDYLIWLDLLHLSLLETLIWGNPTLVSSQTTSLPLNMVDTSAQNPENKVHCGGGR